MRRSPTRWIRNCHTRRLRTFLAARPSFFLLLSRSALSALWLTTPQLFLARTTLIEALQPKRFCCMHKVSQSRFQPVLSEIPTTAYDSSITKAKQDTYLLGCSSFFFFPPPLLSPLFFQRCRRWRPRGGRGRLHIFVQPFCILLGFDGRPERVKVIWRWRGLPFQGSCRPLALEGSLNMYHPVQGEERD